MKQFDLEAALRGEKFISKSSAITILDYKWWEKCGELHVFHSSNGFGLDAGFLVYDREGRLLQNNGSSCPVDLIMVPTKKKGWINIRLNMELEGFHGVLQNNQIFKSKESAASVCSYFSSKDIKQIEIEWEE